MRRSRRLEWRQVHEYTRTLYLRPLFPSQPPPQSKTLSPPLPPFCPDIGFRVWRPTFSQLLAYCHLHALQRTASPNLHRHFQDLALQCPDACSVCVRGSTSVRTCCRAASSPPPRLPPDHSKPDPGCGHSAFIKGATQDALPPVGPSNWEHKIGPYSSTWTFNCGPSSLLTQSGNDGNKIDRSGQLEPFRRFRTFRPTGQKLR